MDPERRRRALQLFEKVRHLPERERREILDRDLAGEPEVRGEVARLLSDADTTVAMDGETLDLSDQPTIAHDSPMVSTHFAGSLRAGQRFGEYHLRRLLGTGGFAQVWEAEGEAGGRRVALKVLNQIDASPEAIQRFQREGKLAASLNHPRCVYVFGAFEIEGHPAIAMEIVPAGSLEDRLREDGALPAKEAVDRILEIVEGLEAAHRLGIIHRDVKPSNCFLETDGHAKIGDFGISRSLEIDTGLTATGTFLGTPLYASPEQVRGEDLDARSDLYAVGATLYALLTGAAPFRAKNAGKLLAEILTQRPVRLSEHGVQVPRGLERVVLRLLEKDPRKRYPDCAALRAALVPFSSRGLTVAGIAGRSAAYILDGGIVDGALALSYTLAGESWMNLAQNPTWSFVGLALAARLIWFTVFEATWGKPPAKWLLGLQVTTVDGRRASFWRVGVRSIVFLSLDSSLFLITLWLDAGDTARGLLSPLGVILVVMTMRFTNGYAGLHELVSGTRVMRRPKTVSRVTTSLGAAGLTSAQTALEPATGRIGPYDLVGQLTRNGCEEILLASDKALDRSVWIRTRPVEAPGNNVHWDVNRSGRLRRLRRGQEEGKIWEAYEAPDGVSLMDAVAARGKLSWEDVRHLLPALLEELGTGLERHDLPDRISLDHLWIDASGQLRLLDFPAGNDRAEEVASGEWLPLLHQFLVLALEGRKTSFAALAGAVPRTPLPEHARRVVLRVCDPGQDPPALSWLQNQLSASSERPTRVKRSPRWWALSFTIFPLLPIIMALSIAMAQPRFVSGEYLLAIFNLLMGLMVAVSIQISFAVVPALVLAFVFRGGPWMRLFGIHVQTVDGRPASRLRCLFRALIVYAPGLLTLALTMTIVAETWAQLDGGSAREIGRAIGSSIRSSGVSMFDANAVIILWLPGALFILGAILALVHPERGAADYIARTHLVPR